MRSLYKYKLDEMTGEISKTEIKEYTEIMGINANGKQEVKAYKIPGYHPIDADKLDRYLHNIVYTFNPSIEYTKRIMISAFRAKYNNAHTIACKCKNILDMLENAPEKMDALSDTHFPITGTENITFKTLNGEIHHGKYDFNLLMQRRWIDDEGNEFQSDEVSDWGINVSE